MKELLKLYAKAYIERDANILLDHLSSIVQYYGQSSCPKRMEKHNFVDFLNKKFDEQRKTSKTFYGIIKLVCVKNISMLFVEAIGQKILIRIECIDNLERTKSGETLTGSQKNILC